ncbi:Nicotinate-nucleotide adenylyltransferase [Anoxybacillus sp. BCO1]|nr:Nicotinate-nucleotide adenylyltransferase [Anoxybacillus sp. BCO1]
MKKVGILGGTFDPPHYGHLLIADDVRTELKLDEIWFMPNYIPPHKDKQVTDHVHRVNMLRMAIANDPHFRVETIELERKERSYTYDTIVLLKKDIRIRHFTSLLAEIWSNICRIGIALMSSFNSFNLSA